MVIFVVCTKISMHLKIVLVSVQQPVSKVSMVFVVCTKNSMHLNIVLVSVQQGRVCNSLYTALRSINVEVMN